MPLDNTGGARAPSAWTLYLDRLKLARRARNRGTLARRRITHQRLAEVERLLSRVIDGADFLAEVEREPEGYAEKAVCLFVTMSLYDFKKLCRYGAEIEDDERTGDDEPSWSAGRGFETDETEPSLGSCDAVMDQTRWSWGTSLEDDKVDEPSLGSCDGIIDQTRWHEGYHHGDNESERLNGADARDSADDEPDVDDEPDERGWPSPAEAGRAS